MLTEAKPTVRLRDVTLRDGLQDTQAIFSPRLRAQVAAGLIRAGVPIVEIGGFSHPKWEPRHNYTDEVARILLTDPTLSRYPTVLSVYCPNDKGVLRAADAGIGVYNIHIAPSARLKQVLLGKNVPEPEEKIVSDMAAVKAVGGRATLYYSDIEQSDLKEVEHLTKKALEKGVEIIYACDTAGTATIESVRPWIETMVRAANDDPSVVGLHLHNKDGNAVEIALYYSQFGIIYDDTVLGGRGMCPADRDDPKGQPNGNMPAEAVVFRYQDNQVELGIDRDALQDVSVLASAMFHLADLDMSHYSVDAVSGLPFIDSFPQSSL